MRHGIIIIIIIIIIIKNITLDTKKLLGKAMVQSVASNGCKAWLLKTEEQRKLLALEMDYLRRSARVLRLILQLGTKCKLNNQFLIEFKEGN